MSNFSSVGDLSRSFHMRLANLTMKYRIENLSKEATSGEKSDIAKYLSGDLTRLNFLDGNIKKIETYQKNASEAAALLAGKQSSMGSIQNIIANLPPTLLSEATTGSRETLLLRADSAGEDLNSIVRALNVDVAGRFVFSGTKSDTPPLSPSENILSELTAVINGLATTEDIMSSIDGWFNSPAGSGGFYDHAYHGSETGVAQIPVSEVHILSDMTTASDGGFREILSGMATIALIFQEKERFSTDQIRYLIREAAESIFSGNAKMTEIRASVGVSEQAVSRSQTFNAAQRSTLLVSRSSIVSADPYEVAISLKEAEAGLENIYALTSRLSNLSLSKYL